MYNSWTIGDSWLNIFDEYWLWAQRPFLLRYGSRDTRHIDFPRVDGQSTDTPVLGRHMINPMHWTSL